MGPVQLDPSLPEDEVPVKIDLIQPSCVEKIDPFDAPDRRIITWKIKRTPLHNQLPVTPYNENPTEEGKKEIISEISKVTSPRHWDDLNKGLQKLSPMRLAFMYREVLFRRFRNSPENCAVLVDSDPQQARFYVISKDVGVKIDADRQAHIDDPAEAEISLKPINSNRSLNTIIPMQGQDNYNNDILRQDKKEEEKDEKKVEKMNQMHQYLIYHPQCKCMTILTLLLVLPPLT
eukprot:15365796-Ditylum_brightwellii.AAC.1